MSYARVLLINPMYPGSRVRSVFSAGLGYIAESLASARIEYEVLDMTLGYGLNDLIKKVDVFKPQLIGITFMTYRYKHTYNMIEQLKVKRPDLDILVGGPHVSLFREKVLEECPAISFGVVMEGEETIVQLGRGVSLPEIKGLIYRDKGQVIYNGDRMFIRDLDAIAFPKYKKFELDRSINKTVNALPIVSSRGCPFDCVYCPVKSSIGQEFRTRSAENIVNELAYWYDLGYRRFSFADDNFTLIKERVYKVCEEIRNRKLGGLLLSCDNGIRADKVDRELLSFMKESGFFRIAFGVEAGNDKVLKNLKKKEDIATIKNRIMEACNLGYEVDLFFLVGSPGETLKDLEDSFRIALNYPIGTAYFYNIVPFPNTELFGWIKNNGKFLRAPQDYLNDYPILDNQPLFETPDMPKSSRKKALRKAFGIMRMTMCRAWAKRLSDLGFLGKVFAYIYTTRFAQDVILRNTLLRKFAYKMAHKVMGS